MTDTFAGAKAQVRLEATLSPLLDAEGREKIITATKARAFYELGARMPANRVYLMTVLDSVRAVGNDPLAIDFHVQRYTISILATEVLSNGEPDPNA